MSKDNRFKFDSEVCKVIHLASLLSKELNYPCVTDIACFIALMLYEDQPLYRRFIEAGITEREIQEVCSRFLTTHTSMSMKQNLYMNLQFSALDGTYDISYHLISIFRHAQFISSKYYARDFFSCKELLAAFSDKLYDVYEDFLKEFPIIYPEPIDNVGDFKEEKNMFTIPRDMAPFLTVLNNNYSPDEVSCDILGRDREIMDMIKTLAKETKRNCILTGYPGVGKTAIVEGFTWMIVTGNCAEKFKDTMVICLDVNAMIAGTHFRGTAEQRFQDLANFLDTHPDCILFIDEIHTILGAGACREGEMDLANSLKPILARGKVRVIGATTEDEYNRYFSQDGALKRRFEKLYVKEPKIEEVYPMIKNKINKLCKAHRVFISREVIDRIIFFASCFNKETRNPDRSLDLIDRAMASAELLGKEEVEMDDVFELFDSNYKKFDKTPLNLRIGLAYHEAGHYLVHRHSPELYNIHTTALSVMPGEGYWGAHVFDYDEDVMPSGTLEYFTQRIACIFAGRISEYMYSQKLSAGASSDLEKASKLATYSVKKYSLVEDFNPFRSYSLPKEDSIITQEDFERMNKEINNIIEASKKYAEKVLLEHADELEILVEALLEKRMLSDKDLNELLDPYDDVNSDKSTSIEKD